VTTAIDVPITVVRLGVEEEAEVLAVLRSGMLAQGPVVGRLESAVARLTGTRHAVAVSSGTTALVVALEALGLGPGDEVVTSPFTFVATVNAVLEAGATVRFADIGDDFMIRPDALAAAIGPRTRVVMPVHLYGQAADLAGIGAVLGDRADITLVEDAAQAIGARFEGRAVGSFGVGCFSLYATKNIGCGEGGVVTTDDDALAERIRLLRNQGMRVRYQYEGAGHNYRLTDLQAAVAVPQLARIEALSATRAAHAAALGAGLDGIEGLVLPEAAPGRLHVWNQYTVRVLPGARTDRDGLAAGLAERGIGTGVYYPRAAYDYDCYRNHPRVVTEPMPAAEAAAREVLSLPVHPHLTPLELERIVTAVREVLG
jgi:dTDP-4-amino-4,6-dideoxygalactose transaminase